MKSKLFIFIIGIFSLFALFNNPAHAESATASSYIKYDLAYPGMLPDNPLYKLKLIRDRITSFLISAPKRKVDFYLLQADKGILATAILIDQKKIELAGKTALRAEHNMTLLVNEIARHPTKPQDDVFEKLIVASKKHQEILESLIRRVSKDDQKVFESVLFFSKSNQKSIEKYQKKHPQRWNTPD